MAIKRKARSASPGGFPSGLAYGREQSLTAITSTTRLSNTIRPKCNKKAFITDSLFFLLRQGFLSATSNQIWVVWSMSNTPLPSLIITEHTRHTRHKITKFVVECCSTFLCFFVLRLTSEPRLCCDSHLCVSRATVAHRAQ